MYIYIHICVYLNAYIYIYIYMRMHKHIYIYILEEPRTHVQETCNEHVFSEHFRTRHTNTNFTHTRTQILKRTHTNTRSTSRTQNPCVFSNTRSANTLERCNQNHFHLSNTLFFIVWSHWLIDWLLQFSFKTLNVWLHNKNARIHNTKIYIYVYIYIYVCMYVCIYIYIYSYIYR